MSEDRLQQFFDYKEIIELKASFGRLADAKDWEFLLAASSGWQVQQ
jgi:hypothetical protein